MAPLAYGVVILAAGRSRRMGRPKMLLPWNDTTVLGHLLQTWKDLGSQQIAVVCAEGDQAVRAELDRMQFPKANQIFNPTPEHGMFSSIQCATRWTGWQPGLTHWVLSLGDQPHLQLKTLQRLLEFGAAHLEKICQPVRNGRRRHPVLLPRATFVSLAETPAADLKAFLGSQSARLAGFEADDPGLDLDLDEPKDYERAKALHQER